MTQTATSWLAELTNKYTPSPSQFAAARSHRASIETRLDYELRVREMFEIGSLKHGTGVWIYSDLERHQEVRLIVKELAATVNGFLTVAATSSRVSSTGGRRLASRWRSGGFDKGRRPVRLLADRAGFWPARKSPMRVAARVPFQIRRGPVTSAVLAAAPNGTCFFAPADRRLAPP